MSSSELTEHTPIKGLVSIFSGNEKKGRWEKVLDQLTRKILDR